MRKLLPVILALIGIGGGVGAGLAFKPEPGAMAEISSCPDTENATADSDHGGKDEHADHGEENSQEYVKLNNQFVIPVVAKEVVDALVVMSLSIEIQAGETETVYTREPKLRDAFLQVLFDHANMGGFNGEFTNANNLDVLRMSLTEAAQGVIGKNATGVLITDIARQDI